MATMTIMIWQVIVKTKKTTTATKSTIKTIPTQTQTSTIKVEAQQKQHKISKKTQINTINK